MSKAREQFLAGTILSALFVAVPAHAAPIDGIKLAQAPQAEKDKTKKPPPHPGQPPQRPPQHPQPVHPQPPQHPMQPPQHQVQPPPHPMQAPVQQRQVQPPPHPMQPPPQHPQQRQAQPPSPPPGAQQHQGQVPPGHALPGMAPGQAQPRQGLPPAPSTAQQPHQLPQPGQPPHPAQLPPPPGQPQQAQQPHQLPEPGRPQPGRPGQFKQGQRPGGPGTPGAPAVPAAQGVPGGRQAVQPPHPVAPNQPLPPPAIAPAALRPPAPPPGSPAAAAQRAFVPPPAQDNARRLDDLRGERHEVREGNRLIIQEPGRVIVQEGGVTIVRHSDIDRFRWQARDVHVEQRGGDTITFFDRPDGSRIYTVTDADGRLLRRYRRGVDGREIVIIDNRYVGPPRIGGYFVDLPPPVIRIPQDRYIIDAQYARPDDIYYALEAPPVAAIERPYTLEEIRDTANLRALMPRVDLDTITFDTGSWEVAPDQIERLAVIAAGINRAVAANPSEVFLIEGHTDAVGNDVDNLSLSDRRAESVALVLSQQFQVPAENLTTQGYGSHYLKVQTSGPERANRRVTVRRITPLLTGQAQPVPGAPPPPQ